MAAFAPNLGISTEHIASAATRLGVQFPDELTTIWTVSNGLELAGGWRFLPVFDPAEPRKTCSDIVYENTKGRWSYMPDNLVVIATGDTGNCLVLAKNDDSLNPQVLLWDHETNRTRRWSRTLIQVLEVARKRFARINRQIERSTRRRK